LEQTKIADFLTCIDDEITKQTEVLDQLKLQKQSLMQKLLTGQVRVKI
jgi:restriction endonuclease S subunit